MLMLMHVGCGTIKCGSTTCRNYDGTCDGGRILVIITITSHKRIEKKNDWETGALQGKSDGT